MTSETIAVSVAWWLVPEETEDWTSTEKGCRWKLLHILCVFLWSKILQKNRQPTPANIQLHYTGTIIVFRNKRNQYVRKSHLENKFNFLLFSVSSRKVDLHPEYRHIIPLHNHTIRRNPLIAGNFQNPWSAVAPRVPWAPSPGSFGTSSASATSAPHRATAPLQRPKTTAPRSTTPRRGRWRSGRWRRRWQRAWPKPGLNLMGSHGTR